MIKNDFNDNVVSEFLMIIPKLEELDIESFNKDITELYKKYTGYNYLVIENLPYEEIVNLLKPSRIEDYTRLLIVATLIFLEGIKLEDYFRMMKSYNIFNTSIEKGLDTKESKFKIVFLKILESLRDFELPSTLYYQIFNHYKYMGEYAKGEDCLYELVELDSSYQNHLQEYYEFLLILNDNELENGGLNKDEVEESLREL